MILNGPMLMFAPKKVWITAISTQRRSAAWLLAAAVTASILPAVAVVGGHLGSAILGYEDTAMAIQRAAIGLVAAIGGALVMAPALTLVLSKVSEAARIDDHTSVIGPAAMGLIWPAWTAGLILAFPPLFGLGPEPGELAWMALASLTALHVIRKGAVPGMCVRRRWAGRFVLQTTVVFVVLFGAITVVPSMLVRSAMGASGTIDHGPPEIADLPLPPKPNW